MSSFSTALMTRCGDVKISTAVVLGLAGFGLLRALSISSSALQFLWRKNLRRGKKLIRYGEWAVVTGASDGIGRAYCNYLAKQGLNIFLVSRTQSKLETAAAEISQEFGVKTKTLAIDLAEAGTKPLDSDAWAELKSSINALDVGVLINNAGKTQGDPSEFHLIDAASLDSTVALNSVAVLKVTHLVLPGMVERGRGAIVNVSSVLSGFPAAPLVSLYSATKGFLDTFTKAIAAEYGPKGIDVQVQVPGPVHTSMLRGGDPESAMKPCPADFMKYAGRDIGYEAVCIPYPRHALFMAIMNALPESMAVNGLKDSLVQLRAKFQAHDKEHGAAADVAAGSTTGPAE
eukprot:jgi/Ulvmu1/11493/UM077_0042.1